MKGQFGFFSRAKKRTKRKKEYFSQQAEILSNLRPRCNARQYLAEQKVKVSLDEDLNLLPELGLDFGLSGSAQVGRALGDATEGEGVAFGRDLRDSVALQRRLIESQQAMERDYWRYREAETRYRHLFETSPEAVLIIEAATLRIREANPAAHPLVGARAASLPGKKLPSVLDKASHGRGPGRLRSPRRRRSDTAKASRLIFLPEFLFSPLISLL